MSNQTPYPPYRELRRSNRNRMFAGVCGGLGEFFGIDPTVIRLLFVFGVVFGWGIMILVYLIIFLVVPEDTQALPPAPPEPPAGES
jgi:phage shock protein C